MKLNYFTALTVHSHTIIWPGAVMEVQLTFPTVHQLPMDKIFMDHIPVTSIPTEVCSCFVCLYCFVLSCFVFSFFFFFSSLTHSYFLKFFAGPNELQSVLGDGMNGHTLPSAASQHQSSNNSVPLARNNYRRSQSPPDVISLD